MARGNPRLAPALTGYAQLCALSCVGCAQLFGLDETDGVTPSGSQMSLQIERVSIGATLEHAPLDLTRQAAAYLVEDASDPSGLRPVPVTLSESKDTWQADIPEGTRAAIEFTAPDPGVLFPRLVAFPARHIKTLFGAYEHPSPEPAPPGGALVVRLTLPTGYAAGEYFRLYAVGPWAMHQLEPPALPPVDTGATSIGPITIPYNAMGFPSLVGARPLPKLTAQDRLVALRYVGYDLTAAALVTPFDQSGGADMVSAALTAVPHAALDVKIDPAGAALRLAGTSPPVTAFGAAWNVVAAPAWKHGNGSGPLLNAAGVAADDPGSVTAQFGNPFEWLGWRSLFIWVTNRSRTFTVPAMSLPVTLYAGLNEVDLVAPGLVLAQAAGLPVLVSLNKIPLNIDGMTIALDPTRSVELGLVADRPANTYYQWNIYELVPNGATPPTALDYRIAYAALSTETTVRIPHGVLVPGKVYTIRAHCVQGGFPAFDAGDLRERDVPQAIGYLDSGVFTVTEP